MNRTQHIDRLPAPPPQVKRRSGGRAASKLYFGHETCTLPLQANVHCVLATCSKGFVKCFQSVPERPLGCTTAASMLPKQARRTSRNTLENRRNKLPKPTVVHFYFGDKLDISDMTFGCSQEITLWLAILLLLILWPIPFPILQILQTCPLTETQYKAIWLQ